MRRYLWDNRELSRDDTSEIIEKSIELHREEAAGLWAVERKGKPGLVGFGGYWYFGEPPQLQILFGLHPEHWGQGLASELADLTASRKPTYSVDGQTFSVFIKASVKSLVWYPKQPFEAAGYAVPESQEAM